MKASVISGDGWVGSVDQYTSSKKRGKFYCVFFERAIPNTDKTEMYNFRFCRKDGKNDFGFIQYRTMQGDWENVTEKIMTRKSGINFSIVPKNLLEYVENIDSVL